MMEDLTVFDTEIIEHAIMRTKREINDLERELKRLRGLNVNRQAELRRRELGAFWQANDGLRLAVGDKLLVTEEAVNKYGGHTRDIGTVVRVYRFEIKDGVVTVDLNLGSRRIGLDIAHRMREAYLQAHGEAQP